MKGALWAMAGMLALLWSSSFSAAQDADPKPQERAATTPLAMVRALQLLQDQVAVGSTNAHVAQRALLARIDENFIPLDSQVWKDQRNVHAAVIFVLSGGKPDILKKLLNLGFLEKQDEQLVQGALNYVEGRENEARILLGDIDVYSLPPSLAGQIALVQSALIVREDPAKSVQLLDFVRLQMPGTLVEEAALRREIFVVSQMGDMKKFESLVRQYLRRFRYSVYAGNFRQRFAASLTRLDFSRDPEHFPRLVAMLSEMDPAGRRELYLLMARAAVEQGQTEAAILAADKAFELSAMDKISAARAKLYKAAAVIVTTKGFQVGLDDLKAIDRTILPPQDVSLLDSALALAQQIRSAPAIPQVNVEPVPSSKAPLDTAKIEQALPAISRARDALLKVDELFKKEVR